MGTMGDQTSAGGGALSHNLESGRRDRLVYIADMLRELEGLAKRDGCPTLAGLLALSSAEAQRQADKG